MLDWNSFDKHNHKHCYTVINCVTRQLRTAQFLGIRLWVAECKRVRRRWILWTCRLVDGNSMCQLEE